MELNDKYLAAVSRSNLLPLSAENRAGNSVVPNRYRIVEVAKGRALRCVEAPTVTVCAERGLSVTAAAARNHPGGAIFLDGAAQGGPFIDAQKGIYNLDHHEGCIRAFTLATCEQAIVLIRKVLDLRKRDWTALVNDADLDTVLALWVLLNHLRLNEDAEVRARVMPLLRLEGTIDAHGLELQELAAFPPEVLCETAATLGQLQEEEAELKRSGRWSKLDLLEYIADRLRAIDEVIYSPHSFEGVEEVEELARAEITDGSIALACRSGTGIYELERHLRKLHGERLGILILQKDPLTYTLRQLDQMLPATLDQAYERLNLMDPAAGGGGSRNRWGGSTEIGGSPRSTGTHLTPVQIADAVRQAFRKPTIHDFFSGLVRAVFIAMAAMLPAVVLIFLGSLPDFRAYIPKETVFPFAGILTVTVGVLFLLEARRAPGLYGWRAPTGLGWLAVFPVALIGAAGGGVWIPPSLGSHEGLRHLNELTVSAALFLSAAAEILFRGLILGDLASRLPIQKSGGPWFVSWPTIISSILYALASFLPLLNSPGGQLQISEWPLTFAAAFVFGITSGIARERSESIIASILLHWVGAAALIVLRMFSF